MIKSSGVSADDYLILHSEKDLRGSNVKTSRSLLSSVDSQANRQSLWYSQPTLTRSEEVVYQEEDVEPQITEAKSVPYKEESASLNDVSYIVNTYINETHH